MIKNRTQPFNLRTQTPGGLVTGYAVAKGTPQDATLTLHLKFHDGMDSNGHYHLADAPIVRAVVGIDQSGAPARWNTDVNLPFPKGGTSADAYEGSVTFDHVNLAKLKDAELAFTGNSRWESIPGNYRVDLSNLSNLGWSSEG